MSMIHNSFFKIVRLSFLGSFLNAFAYAASATGKFQLSTLILPGVIPIAALTALIAGIFLSPLMYWSLKDKCLNTIIPFLYLLAIFLTITLNYFDQRLSFYGSFVFWLSALLTLKFYNIGVYKE